MKDDPQEPEREVHHAPPEFVAAYKAAYPGLRFVTQAEVKRIRLTHGEPSTESEVVGPPQNLEKLVQDAAEALGRPIDPQPDPSIGSNDDLPF